MATASKVTFEVPRDLKRLMDAHADVNWSGVFREAILRHTRAVELAEQILEEQSDPRVQAVAAELKRGAARRVTRGRHARRR